MITFGVETYQSSLLLGYQSSLKATILMKQDVSSNLNRQWHTAHAMYKVIADTFERYPEATRIAQTKRRRACSMGDSQRGGDRLGLPQVDGHHTLSLSCCFCPFFPLGGCGDFASGVCGLRRQQWTCFACSLPFDKSLFWTHHALHFALQLLAGAVQH